MDWNNLDAMTFDDLIAAGWIVESSGPGDQSLLLMPKTLLDEIPADLPIVVIGGEATTFGPATLEGAPMTVATHLPFGVLRDTP